MPRVSKWRRPARKPMTAADRRPGPKPKAPFVKFDRLLTPAEIEKALQDVILEPLKVITVSAALPHLKRQIEAEGGVMRFARLLSVHPSQVSEAVSGRRNGFGRKVAQHLGLKPVYLRVLAYEVLNPRKLYRYKNPLR